jgi:hypothetical protein
MATFAETAILDYRLSLTDQGKQTSVSVCSQQIKICRFPFLFAVHKGSCRFP